MGVEKLIPFLGIVFGHCDVFLRLPSLFFLKIGSLNKSNVIACISQPKLQHNTQQQHNTAQYSTITQYSTTHNNKMHTTIKYNQYTIPIQLHQQLIKIHLVFEGPSSSIIQIQHENTCHQLCKKLARKQLLCTYPAGQSQEAPITLESSKAISK